MNSDVQTHNHSPEELVAALKPVFEGHAIHTPSGMSYELIGSDLVMRGPRNSSTFVTPLERVDHAALSEMFVDLCQIAFSDRDTVDPRALVEAMGALGVPAFDHPARTKVQSLVADTRGYAVSVDAIIAEAQRFVAIERLNPVYALKGIEAADRRNDFLVLRTTADPVALGVADRSWSVAIGETERLRVVAPIGTILPPSEEVLSNFFTAAQDGRVMLCDGVCEVTYPVDDIDAGVLGSLAIGKMLPQFADARGQRRLHSPALDVAYASHEKARSERGAERASTVRDGADRAEIRPKGDAVQR